MCSIEKRIYLVSVMVAGNIGLVGCGSNADTEV